MGPHLASLMVSTLYESLFSHDRDLTERVSYNYKFTAADPTWCWMSVPFPRSETIPSNPIFS